MVRERRGAPGGAREHRLCRSSWTLRWWSSSTEFFSQKDSGVTPRCTRSSPAPERRGGAQCHRGSRTHGRVCNLLGQRRGLQDVARSFSAENRLQTFAVLPFSAPKSLQIPTRRTCHHLSPLCHRSLFGCKSAQNWASSFSAGFFASPARRGSDNPPRRRACHH